LFPKQNFHAASENNKKPSCPCT